MYYFLNKWASMKSADAAATGLKLKGNQSESEIKASKPLSIGSAVKGKIPPEAAVKQVDTTPNIAPRVPNQPVAVSNQSKMPAQSPSGDASTITSPADYAKMAEVQNLLNFFKFVESGALSRNILNSAPRNIES